MRPTAEVDREVFNPYGLYAIHIPLGLVLYSGVSWGAKCLFRPTHVPCP